MPMFRPVHAPLTALALFASAAAVAQSAAPVAPTPPAATTPATTAAPTPCATAEFRGFDFWVGRWDVSRGDNGQLVAHSQIDALHGGCVIREQWMPLRGSGGSSLSHYDAARRSWRQLWLDGTGARVEFDGGVVDSRMVLTGLWPNVNGPGADALIRMTYTRRDDGSVEQRGDMSTDQGLTWSLSFLLVYRPAGEIGGTP